jgi:hypothetical protein
MLAVTASQAGPSSAVGDFPNCTPNGPQVTKARIGSTLRCYLVACQNHPNNVVIASMIRGSGVSAWSPVSVQGVWLSVPVP